jgi:hypothetical protein
LTSFGGYLARIIYKGERKMINVEELTLGQSVWVVDINDTNIIVNESHVELIGETKSGKVFALDFDGGCSIDELSGLYENFNLFDNYQEAKTFANKQALKLFVNDKTLNEEEKETDLDYALKEAERKEAQREYMKKWRAENKDKVKKHQQTYWERKALKKMEDENIYSGKDIKA